MPCPITFDIFATSSIPSFWHFYYGLMLFLFPRPLSFFPFFYCVKDGVLEFFTLLDPFASFPIPTHHAVGNLVSVQIFFHRKIIWMVTPKHIILGLQWINKF